MEAASKAVMGPGSEVLDCQGQGGSTLCQTEEGFKERVGQSLGTISPEPSFGEEVGGLFVIFCISLEGQLKQNFSNETRDQNKQTNKQTK